MFVSAPDDFKSVVQLSRGVKAHNAPENQNTKNTPQVGRSIRPVTPLAPKPGE
jgi:hypothetical protein